MNFTKSLTGYIFIAITLMISSCSGGVKDKDGNIYKTFKIGSQVWMAENLNVSRFRNGDTIPEVKSPDEWAYLGKTGKPAWCIQENNTENGKRYGKLYNWYAVTDPRGLAPKGWHVPSDEEWTTLTNAMGGEVFAALKMRTTGYTKAGEGSSENGFLGLPAGGCTGRGSFYGLGSQSLWWASTEVTSSSAWCRLLNYVNSNFFSVNYEKDYGFSVRCIKD
jgi:uncharacterized protein (TIGR02145 family)